MRVFLVSMMTVVVLAFGSMFFLDEVVQRNADEAFGSSTSVRLPD